MPKAKNLKHLRMKAGLTQEGLSKATGFAKSTINAWETKKRSIPKTRSQELADFFRVSYEDFCDTDLEDLENRFDKPLKLTPIERQHLTMYREMPEDMQDVVRKMIKQIYRMMNGHNEV